MTRHLLFPVRGAALILVVAFTFGYLLSLRAGISGIPLAIILTSWLFKYCFVLLDAIVRGDDEPPVLSAEMVNPVDEQRPVAQALIITAGVLLSGGVNKWLGPTAGVLFSAAQLFALPATIALLGVTGNPFHAVWPPAIVALIRTLGRHYLMLNAVLLGSGAVLYWLFSNGAPIWLLLASTQLLLLFVFAFTGAAVFEHRLELGIDSQTKDERELDRQEREHDSARQRIIDEAYGKFRARKPLEGWQILQDWLVAHGDAGESGAAMTKPDQQDRLLLEYRSLLEAASQWEDARPGDRLANDLIVLLLRKRETGKALAVLEQRLASNPKFRPKQDADTVRLAELASHAGKPGLRRQLGSKPASPA